MATRDRTEQLRKLGKAAERFRYLAAVKMGHKLFADGLVVTAQPSANLFLVAEGLGLAGGDGILVLEELARTRKALTDLLELHEDEPDRPAVANALDVLEGAHEHTGLISFFGLPKAEG